MIEFTRALPEHVELMRGKMREADYRETMAFTGEDPYVVLGYCIHRSTMAWTCFVGGEIAACFGVAPYAMTGRVGRPWMLTTAAMEKCTARLAIYSKKCVKHMLEHYELLENFVDDRHELSKRWLAWLGFKLEKPVPIGIHGERFCYFSMAREG